MKNKGKSGGGASIDAAGVSVWLQQVIALEKAGRLAEARATCQRILSEAPDNVPALRRYAVLCARCGDLQNGVRFMTKALVLAPRDPEGLANLALMYQGLRSLDQAEETLRKSLALAPRNVMGWLTLGNVQKDALRYDEALASYRRALQIDPRLAGAYNNIALVYRDRGELEEAVANFRRALEVMPDCAEAFHGLVKIKKFSEVDDDVRSLQSLLERKDLSLDQRVQLNFSLGKVMDDLGDYDRAFSCFAEANRLKRSTIRYDAARQETLFQAIRQVFTSALFERLETVGYRDSTPIFVVGMPRSGTTLVEQILASHSAVYGAGELYALHDLVVSAARPVGGAMVGYPEYIAALTPSDYHDLGRRYIEVVRRVNSTCAHITDKMPQNFLYLGLIRLILPQAKIIHCIRDPVDTCLSSYVNYLGHEFACDLEELGRYYRLYEGLMAHWRAVMPGEFLEVRYEELVADHESATRRLLDFCGLPWEDECLRPHAAARTVKTLSVAQVRREVYTSSVQRWKRYRKHLGPLLAALALDRDGKS